MSKKHPKEGTDSQLNNSIGDGTESQSQEQTETAASSASAPSTDVMAAARAARQKATKNGVPRSPRLYYLVRLKEDGTADRVIKAFANKYRLRKWFAVAADIDPTLAGSVGVIRGKPMSFKDAME